MYMYSRYLATAECETYSTGLGECWRDDEIFSYIHMAKEVKYTA